MQAVIGGANAEFARLCLVTGVTRPKWERIILSPPDIQALELQNYADQDWTDPSHGSFQDVVQLLTTIGTIAGVVTGVAGAVAALQALKA